MSAGTEETDRYEPAHGSRSIHVEHYDLDLTYRVVPNVLAGVATLTVRTREEVREIALDLAGLTVEEKDDLAPLYRRLLRGIDALYPTPTPYIAAWHQAPVHVARDTVRLMLQVTSPRRGADRLKYLAGSEAAMGAFIGDVAPEAQAAFIREGIEKTGND